jgi:hypothetical protein
LLGLGHFYFALTLFSILRLPGESAVQENGGLPLPSKRKPEALLPDCETGSGGHLREARTLHWPEPPPGLT